ncbi:UbiA prenyltransferase family-domain-containing protein [Boletus reticuloceps]|uniref:Protoheme IX farnesyltransferase, mitochondrial n=1 Tax=Boletus reticuloceps TaxID=495285 RepID=A0A8I3A3I8_9AGAM|nr:UbiA prenyltransferase family-domain-containing protein [Boletus reticuloceps]
MRTLLALQPCSRSSLFRRLVPTRSFHHSVCQQTCPTPPVRKDFASYFFHNDNWGARHVTRLESRPIEPLPTFRETAVLTPKRLLSTYTQLAKARLTVLVVLTATSGVALSPMPTTLPILLSTALGTALCSASANTLNQLQEVPYDAQMARTRQRPLVRRAISPLHATCFAIATGIAGPVLLWTMTTPLTAAIGAANICLYAGLYTYLKRKSILNTWVGAVVGGLPPLMGWTAGGGKLLPTLDYPVKFFLPPFLADAPPDVSMIDNPLGAFALFMLLYSWQFPHFNSLSYLLRASYAQAGYKMLSVLSPQKNALVGLRHTLLLVPICSILVPLSGLTTWTFALTSLIPHCFWVRSAVAFWRSCGEKQARSLFHTSLWYLPLMLALMMVHKQGVDWTDWGIGKGGGDISEDRGEGSQQ